MSHFLSNLFPEESSIPEHYQLRAYVEQREYLINGQLRQWTGTLNPVASPVYIKKSETLTQKIIGSTPLLTKYEALEALDAAVTAYDLGHGAWPTMGVAKRIEHIEKFLAAMRTKRAEVVKLLMWEIGKSLKDSEKEFDRTCDYIVDTVKALKEQDRRSANLIEEQGFLGQIRRVPLGVALCMGPFNYPLNETFTTLIPALIMGNTVVFKPAKYGVLLVKPLLEAFRDSFPAGVINIIYGRGRDTVGALMETGKIDVFAFIGTNKGANELKRLHPKPHRLRSILGLDAKNPAIVLSDADLTNAVAECITGSLSFNGQRCTALKILFVHQSIVAEFTKRYLEELKKLKPGMPWEAGVGLTPLPEPGKTDYLKGLVDNAKLHGAKVMNENGGEISQSYFHPAVLYPVNEKMNIYHEEQFGPIVPIVPFTDDEEPIRYLLNSQFGQQASLFGKDSKRLAKVMDALVNQVGRINLNTQSQRGPDTFPFNGRKDSAEGTLSIADALRVFSIRTIVATKGTDDNKQIFNSIIRNRESDFLSTDYIL
ncbi:MAG: NADP-dependent glyceraldehyde-3-phosphate dehydrogenase [Cytophagales bacterium]|jgi:glyceraldehyde-3-phosphate dehydrogenase (NADP+)|nr:NADP-dependent glyceraldehyde-3-phosphate dehydrogenase [Cytophagales bacterium]MCA6389605.1 NADP-dependent glyceraldehyde-3-phosphate dehydrogenase [Cytophagales bacterium]MCA6390613.1 NADP-dependent glyceraldehyde-3-phosphate dehydrogenase [Cytophagales bacterium]MCA6393553.1 NADP-dependent glyceraldehyde-3-phosphate dehydrogenase [Cytophagales bacterium]MCA6399942.1 NADP-dependent glyceraldehyde-3-phosphate dehydrogenase [Cytophagales bacterium]